MSLRFVVEVIQGLNYVSKTNRDRVFDNYHLLNSGNLLISFYNWLLLKCKSVIAEQKEIIRIVKG